MNIVDTPRLKYLTNLYYTISEKLHSVKGNEAFFMIVNEAIGDESITS